MAKGKSTTILADAILDPNVTILYDTMRQAKMHEKNYYYLISQLPDWMQDSIKNHQNGIKPIFSSTSAIKKGYTDRRVVFDNYSGTWV